MVDINLYIRYLACTVATEKLLELSRCSSVKLKFCISLEFRCVHMLPECDETGSG